MLLVCAFAGFAFLFVVVAGAYFGTAGSVNDRRAWLTLAVSFGCAGAITVWLWRHDRELLERRVKAGPGSESDPVQNIVQGLAGLVFVATFVVPGLNRRGTWSHVPLAVALAGDVLIATGYLIVILTFRANTFTAGVIEIAEGQHLIDTSLYQVVRHPMYAGALVMVAGIPLGLSSWWGLLPASLLIPVIVWRLTREEAFLTANLDGYDAYRHWVRYRLAPAVW